MRVIVSTDPHFTNPGAGIIAGLDGQAAWIFFVAGNNQMGARMSMLMDCWHADDPRVKSQPGLINEHELRGIFRLADSEERIQAYAEQFRLLEKSMETFIEKLAGLSKRVGSLERDEKVLDQIEARLKKLETIQKAG